VKPIVEHTIYIAFAVRGFVFILARPPPESSPAPSGGFSLRLLPGRVPVRAFALRTDARLFLTVAGLPFMPASRALVTRHRKVELWHVAGILPDSI